MRTFLAPVLLGVFAGLASAQDATTTDPGTTEDGNEGDGAAGTGIDGGNGQDPVFEAPPMFVTARLWEESQDDVPMSLTVLDQDVIEQSGIRSVQDATFFIPNLYITEFTSRRLSFPYIRGIGSGEGDPAVVTYVDGVPQLTTSSTNLSLLDVERLEFLRGAQSNLYGRNAIGGVIKYETQKPSWDKGGEAKLMFGSDGLEHYQLSYNTPVSDTVAVKGSAAWNRRDGYTENQFTGHDVDDRSSLFARGQLLWVPDDHNEVRFTIYGERSRDGGFALSSIAGLKANPWEITQDYEGDAERDIVAPSVTWTHSFDNAEFVSITALNDWEIKENADFDFSPIDGVRRRTQEEQTYLTQELRLQSAPDAPSELSDNVDLRWVAGLFGFTSSSDRSAANEFRPGGAGILFPPTNVGTDTLTGDFTDNSFAAYGQATITVNDNLDFTGGLRYDYESTRATTGRTFETGGFTVLDTTTRDDDSYDEISPSFSVAYRADDYGMVYGSATKGFKAGGFNLAAPAGRESFDPETAWNYEIGGRVEPCEKLTLGASVFYIDWEDLQLSQFDPLIGGYVDNAGDATSQGFELEAEARPLTDWTVRGSLGVVATELEDYIDPFGTNTDGNDLPFAPDTIWTLGTHYSHPLCFCDCTRWFVGGEYRNVGPFHYDAANTESERFDLVNVHAGLSGERWRVSVFVKNLFNEDYIPVAFALAPGAFVGENGEPRVIGVSGTLTF